MIRNFLSRYRPRYLRSLAYILQASEYKLRDYFAWFWTVRDFTAVEKRKSFVRTAKSMLVLILLWLLAATFLFLGAWIFSFLSGLSAWAFAVVFILLLPYMVSCGIAVLLILVQIVVQKPIEQVILRRARRIIQNHKAIKIAIAGSFGKTSMREILKTVLSEGKKVSAPPHSHNTPLGISAFIKTLKGDEEVLIFELGEYYPGDVRNLCGLVSPDIGIITGVNEAHLDKFKTLDRTAKTIFELADYLGTKPVYVNGENEIATQHAASGHLTYSRAGVAEWQIKDAKTGLDGTSFVLTDGKSRLKVESCLLGLHQVGPLAAAAHVALRLGLTHGEIEKGLQNTRPFEHRMEKRMDENGIVTLDDSYNGNPDGVAAVIRFLAALHGHRRIYVTPGLVEMGSRAKAVHKEIGRELAEAGIEKVVLIKNSVTSYIEQGLKENSYRGEIIWFKDALAAFKALPFLSVQGDIVLLQNDWPDQYR